MKTRHWVLDGLVRKISYYYSRNEGISIDDVFMKISLYIGTVMCFTAAIL